MRLDFPARRKSPSIGSHLEGRFCLLSRLSSRAKPGTRVLDCVTEATATFPARGTTSPTPPSEVSPSSSPRVSDRALWDGQDHVEGSWPQPGYHRVRTRHSSPGGLPVIVHKSRHARINAQATDPPWPPLPSGPNSSELSRSDRAPAMSSADGRRAVHEKDGMAHVLSSEMESGLPTPGQITSLER